MISKVVMLAGQQYCTQIPLEVGFVVTFEPEIDNTFDPYALKVMFKDQHIGYVPNTKNICTNCLETTKEVVCSKCKNIAKSNLCVILSNRELSGFVSSVHGSKIFITILCQ